MPYGKLVISETLVVILLGLCVDRRLGQPVSYRDPSPNQPVEMTTTPKKIKDAFQLNKQVMPIPQNDSKKSQPFKSHLIDKMKNNDLAYEPVTYKVKSAKVGDKGARQNEDDDDDDDGGEYDGVADYANCKKKDQEEQQEKKSMPMMIIRGFDVMAMDVPMPSGKTQCKKPNDEKPKEQCDQTQDLDDKTSDQYDEATQFQSTTIRTFNQDPNPYRNGYNQEQTTRRNGCNNQYQTTSTPQNGGCNHKGETLKDIKDRDSGVPKDSKDPTDKYRDTSWGEWSPCSKSCGEGVQTRSRARTSGSTDAQFRVCHLADCPSESRILESSHGAPVALQYRQPLKI